MNPNSSEKLRQRALHYERGNWGFAEWATFSALAVSMATGAFAIIHEVLQY